MHRFHNFTARFALAGLGLALVAMPAHATTLSGNYNNQTVDGYDAAAGDNVTILPSATFDTNGNSGLSLTNSSTLTPITVNIAGGDFSHNGFDGVFTALGSTVNVAGGTFNNDFDGLGAFNSTVDITGGDFTGNSGLSLLSYGSNITLFGNFASYGLVPNAPTFSPGSFTGTLQNNSTPQTFTYGELDSGTITLAPAITAVPETSSLSLLALSLLPLGLIVKRKMSRRA